MLEYQFIQFSDSIDPMDSSIAIPMVHDQECAIFIPRSSQYSDPNTYTEMCSIVTADGKTILSRVVNTYSCIDDQKVPQEAMYSIIKDLSMLAPNDAFRIKVDTVETISPLRALHTRYSSKLCRTEEKLSELKYRCDTDAFGFPFRLRVNKLSQGVERSYVQCSMPVLLSKPQLKQDDKVYTKRNGENVVLYATITKEYDGETDYIPMDWHEKIAMALSCDEVYINGERVTKSESYEIDHDNYTFADNGVRLMRATFKAKTNVTQRNSNY